MEFPTDKNSKVNDLYDLIVDLDKLVSNYKKDGLVRKTKVYFQKKLESVNTLKTRILEYSTEIQPETLENEEEYLKTLTTATKLGNWIVDSITKELGRIEEFHKANPDVPLESISLELLKSTSFQAAVDSERNVEPEDRSFFTENNDEGDDALRKLVKAQEGLIISANHQIGNLNIKLKLTKEQAEYRLERLQRTFDRIESTDMDIWALATGNKCFGYNHNIFFSVADAVENMVTTYKMGMKQDEMRNSQKLPKLPELGCPTFSGKYKDWLNFAQLFNELIHNRKDLGKIQKIMYLKDNLVGEPKELVRNMTLTEENYDSAVAILSERYNNKRKIANEHFEVMFDRPALTEQNARDLKTLHDDVNVSIQGLLQLGLKVKEWDPILVFLITRKLDPKTRVTFETSLKDSKVSPPLETLLSFLRSRFSALEALGDLKTDSMKSYSNGKQNTLVVTSENCSFGCRDGHFLHSCPRFKELSVSDRYDHVKANRLCLNCLRPNHMVQNCRFSPCLKCHRKHSTWLHIERPPKTLPYTTEPPKEPTPSSLATTDSKEGRNYILLATTMVSITTKDTNKRIVCRAILDSASQLNFVSSSVFKRLGVSGNRTAVEVEGIGQTSKGCETKVNLQINAISTDFTINVADVMVLESITSKHPGVLLDTKKFDLPGNINLADEEFYQPKEIGLLLGAGIVGQVLTSGNLSLGEKMPSLQNTKFGWVALGEVYVNDSGKHFCGIVSNSKDQEMKELWERDYGEGFSKIRKNENLLCENFFESTSYRNSDGKFVVRLPFTKNRNVLGNSQFVARRRFLNMEKKLYLDDNLRHEYFSFMQTYLSMGHMEEVKFSDIPKNGNCYYLPHHYVLKPHSSTTKLRVVFDATSVTSTGLSLNDVLAKGPRLQKDLFDTILRFRSNQYALCADIKMMFRQIEIHPPDQMFQLIFFRFHQQDPVKTYKLKTVTYGTSSAPYLSVKCLQRLAFENSEKYPLAAKTLLEEFYMDDMLTGGDDLATVKQIRDDIVKILASGGFHIRKWATNEKQLLEGIPEADCENLDNYLKVLGVHWDTSVDEFLLPFPSKAPNPNSITKRYVLTKISEIFDPLGLINPLLVEARILLQDVWESKVDWDEPINDELKERWCKFYDGLKQMEKISIQRNLFIESAEVIELHGFCDASASAYGAVIYSRSIVGDSIFTNLICSKGRVVSLKKRQEKISMPKLELCAAVLLVELVARVCESISKPISLIRYYTDSTTVIHWTHKNPSELTPFVSRRIATIQRLSQPYSWRYVRSKNNPADLISRGVSAKKFACNNNWFIGPEFLRQNPIETDSFPNDPYDTSEDKIIPSTLYTAHKWGILNLNINHKNNFDFLVGIVSNIVKFTHQKGGDDRKTGREKALELIVGCMQEEFAEEKQCLLKNHDLKSTSKLKTLSPFLDSSGLIRVGGRISKASQLKFDARHPWVLSYSHPFTHLLVKHTHHKYLHVAPQALLYILRQQFWPLRGRQLTRQVVNHCYRCFRLCPRSFEQVMGNLPSDRLIPQRPFLICGVDFIGPMKIHHKIRGKRPDKAYVSVFVCFVSKAIHIEVVCDLTANAFVAALKRMIGRRGCPLKMYSDNGSNFKCAAREIELNMQSAELESFTDTRSIEWNFIPARSPHMGGIWEAAVKSIKSHYERVVQYYSLNFEELQTIMIEIEAVLNSRPLTPMSDDPNDLQVLTPGHFLIGEPLTSLPDSSQFRNVDVRKNWGAIVALKNEFWERWSNEYLNELQKRFKWTKGECNVEPGDLVLLKDDDTKPLNWRRGRVISCVRGDDNRIRVVNLKTSTGVTTRTVHKVCPIPSEIPNFYINDLEEVKKAEMVESKNCNSLISTKRLLNMFLIILLIIPLAQSNSIFENITDTSGLFFEDLGQCRVILSNFRVVAFFDLDNYWAARSGIIDAFKQQRLSCHLADERFTEITGCVVIMEQLQRRWEQSERIHNFIFRERRQKRALLKFAGTLLHDVFGVMDEDTANKYDRRIEENSQNQQYTINMLESMAVLHNSTMNIIEENNQKITEGFSKLNSKLLRLSTMLDVYEFRNFITNSILALEEFKDLQMGIWEALRDVHTGIFNPTIIEPEQLMTLIDGVRTSLPPMLTFPSNDIFVLMKFLEIRASATKNNIIFEVGIPLIGTELFTMYQVHPFPIVHNEFLVNIVPNLKYLLINSMMDRYLEVQKLNDVHSCRKVNEIWLCRGINKIHHAKGVKSCEINQFLHQNPVAMKYCQIQLAAKQLVITQLSTTNHWLVTEPGVEIFEMNCGDGHSKHSIHGRGILKGQIGCQIRTPTVTLLSYEESSRNLSFAKSEFDLSTYLRNDNNNTIFINATELEFGPIKLKELPRAPPAADFRLPMHDVHQFAVGYTSLIIVVVVTVIVFCLIRRYRTVLFTLGSLTTNLTSMKALIKPTPEPRDPPVFENEV